MNINEKKLVELQEALPSLNELDVLECIWELKEEMFNELCDKYLINQDDEYYAEDSEQIKDIRPYIIEWFGEDYAFVIKTGEYFLLSFAIKEDDMKYWEISKINVNNQEMARKVAYSIAFVSNFSFD